MFGGGILGSGKAGSCPRCGKEGDVRLAGAEGVIERNLLAKLHVHPFHCLHCGSRFRRFSWDPNAVAKEGRQEPSRTAKRKGGKRSGRRRESPGSMPGQSEEESFEAVIAEVRKAELELERRESRKSGSDSIPRIG